MDRLIVATALFAGFVAVILLGIVWHQSRPRINKANFDRVELGMTKKDVEGILGTDTMTVIPSSKNNLIPGYIECEWKDHEEFASVCFDKHDRVAYQQWFGWRERRDPWTEKIYDFLPWHRPSQPPIPR